MSDNASLKTIHNSADPEVASDSIELCQSPNHKGIENNAHLETDWVFLEDVRDYMKCDICCNVYEAPQLLTCCGRSICKKCIEHHLQRAAVLADKKPSCPFCRKKEFRRVNNTALELSINQLKVQCLYHNSGCGWTGTLQNGNLHLIRECDFFPTDCPYKCGCKQFERCKLSDHMTKCSLRPMNCSFVKVGCSHEELLHGELAKKKHIADNIHHHLLLVAQLNAQISAECRSFHSKCTKTIKENNEAISSQRKTLSQLKSAVKSLEDCLPETQQKNYSLRQELARMTICLTELKKKDKQMMNTGTSCKAATDQIQAFAIPKTLGISCPPVVFTINYFRKRMATNDRWFSPPFYTHVGGYRMCFSVYPNGCGHTAHGKYVSVYLHVMTGEFDDHLNWPFPGAIVTLTAICQRRIRNRSNKSTHIELRGEDTKYIRSRQIDSSFGYGYGLSLFLQHNALPSFLNRDSLEIMVYRIQFLPL